MDTPRPPRREEMDDLHRLSAISFGFETRPPDPRRKRLPKVPAGARIIALDGKPVSVIHMVYNHLFVEGARVKVVSFGGVCTHPDYRERGLASRLLQSCLAEATAAKATLLIISGARGLYRRAHAVLSGPTWQTALRPGDLPAASEAVTVRRAGPEDWLSLARLYEAEPVRFARVAAFYQHTVEHSHRGPWLVEQQGRPVAYACLARVWDEHHDNTVRALGEYAGSRAALLEGMPGLFAAAGLSKLHMEVPRFDEELTFLCQQRGLSLTPGTLRDHTIRLVNLPELVRTLRPYLLARLSPREARALSFAQTEEVCRFAYGAESQEMDLTQAGALVLGGPRAPRVGGGLGAVLARVLPVPVPLPGMNYV